MKRNLHRRIRNPAGGSGYASLSIRRECQTVQIFFDSLYLQIPNESMRHMEAAIVADIHPRSTLHEQRGMRIIASDICFVIRVPLRFESVVVAAITAMPCEWHLFDANGATGKRVAADLRRLAQ